MQEFGIVGLLAVLGMELFSSTKQRTTWHDTIAVTWKTARNIYERYTQWWGAMKFHYYYYYMIFLPIFELQGPNQDRICENYNTVLQKMEG
jgi:hypothetical protein